MKKTLLELQRELDDTENIIRACDTAQVYGLTFDSASFDKYNEATEKQKELLKIEENIRRANERLNERIKEAKASQNN